MITWLDVRKHGVVAIFKRTVDVNPGSTICLQFNRQMECLVHWRRRYVQRVFYDTVNITTVLYVVKCSRY